MAATLKYSKVIIDEIQSYEPRIVVVLTDGFKNDFTDGRKICYYDSNTSTVHFMNKYGLIKNETYCFGIFACDAETYDKII